MCALVTGVQTCALPIYHMVAVREEPKFDMSVPPCQLVIAFVYFFPAAFFDPFGEMKGGDDRDLDFGRDAEQPERQALRLIEVGVGRAVAPMRLAIGADEPEAAREGRSEGHTSELQSLMRISYA